MSSQKKYQNVKSRQKGIEKPVRKSGDGAEQKPAGV